MSTSTRPRKATAKKAPATEATEVSPVSAWKKPAKIHTLPSGNGMKIKRTTLQALLAQGLIPNSLMSIVQKAVATGSNDPEAEMAEVMSDPNKLAELMSMMDTITIHCAIEPAVHPEPESEEDRDPELLYVDELDEADKTFIFNTAIGAVTELEPFRK